MRMMLQLIEKQELDKNEIINEIKKSKRSNDNEDEPNAGMFG